MSIPSITDRPLLAPGFELGSAVIINRSSSYLSFQDEGLDGYFKTLYIIPSLPKSDEVFKILID